MPPQPIRRIKVKSLQKIITNGQKADEDTFNKQGVVLKYQGKPANEGLLLWIKNESGQVQTVQFNTYWDKIKGLSNEACCQFIT